jgi:hypothetical protein
VSQSQSELFENELSERIVEWSKAEVASLEKLTI